jgi:cytochrome c-type biogenesis protein CcmH
MALWLGLWLALAPAVADEMTPLAEPPLGDPITSAAEVQARAEHIGDQLRCPVCQALSVADSSSEAARAMQDRIAELVAQGYTDVQIEDYFVDRYGEWVRLEPPKTGLDLLVWLGPVVLLGLGALTIIARRSGGPADAPVPATPVATVDDELRARVLAELDGEA